MSEPLVLESQSSAVRTLTLNHPPARNSFTSELQAALIAGLQAAAFRAQRAARFEER